MKALQVPFWIWICVAVMAVVFVAIIAIVYVAVTRRTRVKPRIVPTTLSTMHGGNIYIRASNSEPPS